MIKLELSVYLNKKAENWVSIFVLLGCIAITAVLVLAAMKADALGGRFADAPGYETIVSN